MMNTTPRCNRQIKLQLSGLTAAKYGYTLCNS